MLDDARTIERHADLEHEIWAGWMQYLFLHGTFNDDGTWTMPAEMVERYRRLMHTPYCDLTDRERGSDREQARLHLHLEKTGEIIRCTIKEAKNDTGKAGENRGNRKKSTEHPGDGAAGADSVPAGETGGAVSD